MEVASMSRRTAGALLAALTAALIVAAVAIASGGGAGIGKSHGGLGSKLTYAEIHLQKNGQDVVKRIDRGVVKAFDGSSVTITRNDNQDVTIPTDGNTRVFGKHRWRSHSSHNKGSATLAVGQTVIVVRKLGQPARYIWIKSGNGHGPPGFGVHHHGKHN
jgi:hypothetical protein